MARFRRVFVVPAFLLAATVGAIAQTPPEPFTAAGAQPPPFPKLSGGANLGSAQLYAFVDSSGQLDQSRSKGTVPCADIGGTCLYAGSGYYRIRFARDVSACTISAIAGPTSGFTVLIHTNASHATGLPNGVLVATYNASGVVTGASFRVLVIC